MAEVLDCYEVREPRHAVHEVSGLNNSFRSSSHLPRINLPIFDGSFDKWESFRDKFKSMIHEDQSLMNVERMHYLCSCVKGDASNVFDHLAVMIISLSRGIFSLLDIIINVASVTSKLRAHAELRR